MNYCKNFVNHFITITEHRILVAKGCFAMGLYRQGLVHDLSKYSPEEFLVGVKYYTGVNSPNAEERKDKGYSRSWMHHKGRNKHHFEYWVDLSVEDRSLGYVPVKMPLRYVLEMLADRIAACKVYQKDAYTDESPRNYYNMGKKFITMHPDTRALLEKLLDMLAAEGEEKTFRYAKFLMKLKKEY